MSRIAATVLILSLAAAFLQQAVACPVCFGANDSPMNAGMNTAIAVMLGITGCVLGIIGAFFLMMWRRCRRQRNQLSEGAFIDDRGNLRMNDEKGVMEWNNF